MLTTIVPNFNHANYIRESLSSLISQTRPTDELIVIDDNSSDESVEIITPLLLRHPNARLIRNSKNQGCNANMNQGLRLARGSYIHFAAADDIFNPNLYRIGVAMLEACPKAAVFSARSETIDEFGRSLENTLPRPGYPLSKGGYISPAAAERYLIRNDSWFMGNTAVYRTICLRQEGGFPEDLFAFSDGFMCRLLALRYGACFAPDTLGSWRRLESGMASSLTTNIEAATTYISATQAKMLNSGTLFPPKYIRRWRGRQEYAIRRYALGRRNDSAHRRVCVWGWFHEKIYIAWLALRWRPWDLGAYVRNKIISLLA